MESIADLLANHTGENIEVMTNGGQLLAGRIEDVYQDYFVLSSTTRLYVVLYTGISTFYLPPGPDSKQPTLNIRKSPVGVKHRKTSKQTRT